MGHCPTCGQSIDAATSGSVAGRKPVGRQLPEEAVGWVPVARLTNLAEAGFAESLLAEAGIASFLRQVDDFSALDGSWSQVYVLQVPEQQADQAAEQLGAELLDAAATSPVPDDAGLPSPPTAAPTPWVPLALLLVVGSLIYVAASGQLIPKGRSTRTPLGDALRMLDQPVESARWAGTPHYRVRFDPPRQAIVIEEDRDGDHIYERRREFYRNRRGHWLER